MIISGSHLQLAGSHAYLEQHSSRESLSSWRDGPGGRQQIDLESTSERLQLEASSDRLTLSTEAMRLPTLAEAPPAKLPETTGTTSLGKVDATVPEVGELKFMLLRLLVEKLTGHAIKVFDTGALKPAAEAPTPAPTPTAVIEAPSVGATNEPAAWGMTYRLEETYLERESTQFTAQGVVHTADGKEIRLELELNMSREFVSRTSLTVGAGEALKDPLVINFGGNAAQLTQDTFRFDIDADGEPERMHFVAPGSGFLALDQNGDGEINDGRELFGALSGDGFADLARYDDDGNGWIDERDAVFSRLLIWSRQDDGTEQLQGLLHHGIGAIHLGQAATPFSLKDDGNALQGAVRATGIYLRQDGGAGTLQQIDLVV